MKISSALSQARKDLDSKGVGNSGLDALILLSHTLFLSKEQIIFNPDFELTAAQEKEFFALISRRQNREPVSHLIGKREFYGEDFLVSKNVLDPRPDSESLIELVLESFPQKDQKLKILEIGVGSGCLIITLLRAFKEALGNGLDISPAALEMAQKNADLHKVADRLRFAKSDLFAALNASQQFDLIISNPPYIPSADIEELEPEVKIHEPRNALDGGSDGLDFYRRIAAESADFLAENGKIILEIGHDQNEKVVEIFTQNGFQLIASKLDLSGITRALCFKK